VQQQILRIVDANINRVSEGLRVLEDIARFIVEDEDISRQLKTLRHQLNGLVEGIGVPVIETRDAANDVGANFDVIQDHKDLASIARANAKRAQQGLRVMEELSKLPELKASLSSASLKEFRYKVYSLEKILITGLADRQGDNRLPGQA
jgi:thiamine-phosphate pyrophosphorylase